MNFENTKKALELFARAVIAQAKKNLRTKNPNPKYDNQIGSGALEKSLTHNLKVFPNSFTLEFYMEDYGPFIDEGVKGSKSTYRESRNSPFKYTGNKKTVNPKALDKWLIRKGIAPRGKDGRFMTRKSLKYIIAKSIYEKGIRGSKFFKQPFEDEFEKINQDVIDAFGLDVNDFLIKTQVV